VHYDVCVSPDGRGEVGVHRCCETIVMPLGGGEERGERGEERDERERSKEGKRRGEGEG
jgi:hypothetical protein